MEGPDNSENSRSILLRRDVEHRVLKPLRSFGWSVTVESSTDPVNISEIAIDTGSRARLDLLRSFPYVVLQYRSNSVIKVSPIFRPPRLG